MLAAARKPVWARHVSAVPKRAGGISVRVSNAASGIFAVAHARQPWLIAHQLRVLGRKEMGDDYGAPAAMTISYRRLFSTGDIPMLINRRPVGGRVNAEINVSSCGAIT